MFLWNVGNTAHCHMVWNTNIGFVFAVNYHKGLKSVIQMFVSLSLSLKITVRT
jgi:anthranilate phosphoribosyltransferase